MAFNVKFINDSSVRKIRKLVSKYDSPIKLVSQPGKQLNKFLITTFLLLTVMVVLATFAFRIPVFLVIPSTSFIDLRAKSVKIPTLVKRAVPLMSGTNNINGVSTTRIVKVLSEHLKNTHADLSATMKHFTLHFMSHRLNPVPGVDQNYRSSVD